MRSRDALLSDKMPRRQRIIERRREWMLRRQPITNRQRPYPGSSARLRYHPAMTENGTGAIATPMEKHQDAGSITAGNDRPFSRHAADIEAGELHVIGYRPNRTDLVEALGAGRNSHTRHFGQNRPSLPVCRWVAIAKSTNMAGRAYRAAAGVPGSKPTPPANAGLSRAAPGEPGQGGSRTARFARARHPPSYSVAPHIRK